MGSAPSSSESANEASGLPELAACPIEDMDADAQRQELVHVRLHLAHMERLGARLHDIQQRPPGSRASEILRAESSVTIARMTAILKGRQASLVAALASRVDTSSTEPTCEAPTEQGVTDHGTTTPSNGGVYGNALAPTLRRRLPHQ